MWWLDTLLVFFMTTSLFICSVSLANIHFQLSLIYSHIRDRGHGMGGVENKLERIRVELAKQASI